MSEPIAGSIGVAVVPNAERFWEDFKAKTRAGAENGVQVKVRADTGDAEAQIAGLKAEARAGSADVKVKADTSDARLQMHLLSDAIIGIGPAAIPVAAVAGGAMLGLVPVAATVALAISGISKQMKSSALQGTSFAAGVNTLKSEVASLQQTAAAGLLTGLNQAIGQSAPLFKTVNADVAVMSHQLGAIVSGVAPALVQILTDLNPLFVTLGNVLVGGAHNLERFAKSGTGIQSFVAYVQTELPVVVRDLGQLIEFAGRLVQALAPMGHAILQGIGTLASVLNTIPVNVLALLADGALATYAAFRTYQYITPIINGTSKAIDSFAARQAASAAVAEASALQVEAASAQRAAAVAAANAVEANAAAEAAVKIAASVEGTSSVLAEGAAAAAAASLEFAAAMQVEAEAAAASAAVVTASADEASAGVKAAGAGAAIGWAGLLGPIAAVGVGVAVLTGLFASNNDQAVKNQKIMDAYAASLQKSSDALAGVNVAQTAKNLQDDGALKLVDQLSVSNAGLGLTYGRLAVAVNGSQAEFDSLITTLKGVAEAGKNADFVPQNTRYRPPNAASAEYDAQGQAALKLVAKLTTLRGELTQSELIQAQYAEAQQEAQIAIDGGTTAVAAQARAYGSTADAYLAAQQAAKKNTDQTNAQTLAYQLENDAASILKGTLDELNGKKLSAADALNAFQASLVNFTTGGSAGSGPSSGQQAAAGAAAQGAKVATDALAVAQEKYNAALAKGNTTQIASAHLALERAQLAVTRSTNAAAAANAKLSSSGYVAAGTITGMDSASVSLRGELNQQIHNLESLVEANGGWANSTRQSRKEMEKLRQQIIDNAVAHGVDRTAVTKYVDSLFAIPKTIPPMPLDINTAKAHADIVALRAAIAASIKIRATVVANVVAAARVNGPNSGRGTFGVEVANAQGNVIDYGPNRMANVKHFADGMENHVAQFGDGTRRIWDEPETGGEAYIPLSESKRARSEAILGEVAKRFGGDYSRHPAAGAAVGGSRTVTLNQTNNYVGAVPGVDPAAELRRQANRWGT